MRFELVDHGIDNPRYFRGCEAAFTAFGNCVTGVGSNPAEAIDDCLEQLATVGVDIEGLERRILASEGWESFPTAPQAPVYRDADLYYYVSIRWRGDK